MSIYYLKNNTNDKNIMMRNSGAFGKARQDAYAFFDEIGAKPIGVYSYKWDYEPAISLDSRMDGMLGILKKGDIVIQSYPTASNSPVHTRTLIKKIKTTFESTIIAYIHDIGAFRATFREHELGIIDLPGVLNYTKEIINYYDGLIVPTIAMAKKIRYDFAYKGPITVQGPYGFKSQYINTTDNKSLNINFAGSLSKAKYLNQLVSKSPQLYFNLYGSVEGEFGRSKLVLEKNKNIEYKGQFDPDAIVSELNSGLGLIWDSDEYEYISGGLGLYQLVNAPHKFSMYIAAGIPVISWSNAAISLYIRKHNLGWSIDSLQELDDLILNITENDLLEKKENVDKFSDYIRNGFGLKKALFDLIQKIECNDTEEATPVVDPIPEIGLNAFNNRIYKFATDENEI